MQRQRSLPAATDDVKVLAAEESKREEFGVVAIDGGTVLGAAKMSYDVVSKRFRIDGLADARCAPLRWTSPNAPGVNPTSLGESSHIRARFGSDPYDIELKPNGTEMEMELHVVRP